MARDMVSIVKRSRREKVALHPKAVKALVKRSYAPGEHGQTNMRQKMSQYAVQLREKQKVKRIYGLLEKQFAKVVQHAERKPGVSGENLLQMLELRLDNTIYRAGFATSRQAARQLVTHGHFMLNDARVDVPSILVKPGDVIVARAKSGANGYFKANAELIAGNQVQHGWLSVDNKKLAIKITGLPTREDSDPDINEQLIIEFYSR
jgi:small subunit ribosomal protein S4